HRVALEMAGEEPELGLDVELGHDLALAELATAVVDLEDAVEHQHGRQWELRVARPEQAPLGALDQVLEGVTVLLVGHSQRPTAVRNRNCGRIRRAALQRKPAKPAAEAFSGPPQDLTYGANDARNQSRFFRPFAYRWLAPDPPAGGLGAPA